MLSFIPHILFVLSMAGILVILGKKLPKIERNEHESSALEGMAQEGYVATTSFFHDVANSASILTTKMLGHEQRERAMIFIEKVLRRLRVLLMRLENKLSKILESFSSHSSRRVLKQRFDQDSEHKIAWKDIREAPGKNFPAFPKSSMRSSAPVVSAATVSEDEEFWLSALRHNPHNPHPYKKLGELYMKRGNYKEARAVFAYALKRNPQDTETEKWLEEILKKK